MSTCKPAVPPSRGMGALIEAPGQHDEIVGGPNRDAAEDLLRVGAAPPPAEALGLVRALPAFKDQDGTNTCYPHAICNAAETRLAALGKPVEPSSIPEVYCAANALIEPPGAPLEDVGTYGRVAMLVTKDWGVARDRDYPLWDKSTGRVIPGIVTRRVPGDVLQRASSWKLEEQLTVYATGDDRILTIRAALAANEPIPTAGVVDTAFMRYDGRGVIGAPNMSAFQGRHAVCIVGYRTNPRTGRFEFLIRNSWRSWGLVFQNQVSMAWVSEDWVRAQEEMFRMRVTHARRTS